MRAPQALPALLVLLTVLAPLAAGHAGEEHGIVGFPTARAGPLDVTYWVTPPGADDPADAYAPGDAGVFHLAAAVARGDMNVTYVVAYNVTGPVNWTGGTTANATVFPGDEPSPLDFAFTVPADAGEGTTVREVAALAVVYARNATSGNLSEVARASVAYPVTVVRPVAPVEPGLPSWVWWGGAVVVALAAVGGVVLRGRRRQVRVAPRSRTLQELRVEERVEKARRPEAAAAEAEAERQAIEARERERLAVREQSILEAKRNDLLRSIELARQRHERGELSAFQFQKLKEKKEQQLADLDREHGGGSA